MPACAGASMPTCHTNTPQLSTEHHTAVHILAAVLTLTDLRPFAPWMVSCSSPAKVDSRNFLQAHKHTRSVGEQQLSHSTSLKQPSKSGQQELQATTQASKKYG
jgi:hypothetical protein